jgi:Mg2+ and Co2+ transporter CorA
MIRPIGICIALGLLFSLSACSETCESVKEEVREIEQEIEKDPQSAGDHTEELGTLLEKMTELKCYP